MDEPRTEPAAAPAVDGADPLAVGVAELGGDLGPPLIDGGAAPPLPDPHWARHFVVQLIVAGLLATALHASRPMVTYRAIGLGAGPLEIGLVQSAFSVLPVFTAVALGRWVDRVGEARFLVAAMGLVSVGSLVATLAGSLVALAVAQSIMGFGQIINLVAGQVMIANRGPRDRREHRFGWYSTVVSTGQLVGPIVAAALVGGSIALTSSAGVSLGASSEAPVFLFAAAATAIAGVLALRLPHRPPRRRDGAEAAGPAPGLLAATVLVLRRPGMGVAILVSVIIISTVDVLIAYLPAYGEATGLTVQTVALLLSVRAGASLVSRLFMAQLIERLGRVRLLAGSMALAGGGIVLLPFISSTPMLIGLMVVIGLGLGLGQPMTIAWVANRSERRERALALGVRITGNRAALLVVPTVMGVVAGASGLAAIWIVLAVLLGSGAAIAARTPFDELVNRPRPPRQGAHGGG